MCKNLYSSNIEQRSLLRFIIGLYPRIKQYIKYTKSRNLAIKRGAAIGFNTALAYNLAKRANENLTVGDNTSIRTSDLALRAPIKIGNNVIIDGSSKILTSGHNIDSTEWEPKRCGLEIEDYVWISSNVLISPSCRKIGYGAVIGAGAVVVKDVEPMSVVGGNPAKHIKYRKCVHSDLVVPSVPSYDLKIYWRTWMSKNNKK